MTRSDIWGFDDQPLRDSFVMFSVRQIGQKNTTAFRAFLGRFLILSPTRRVWICVEKNGSPISAFHDVPLWADKAAGIMNMIVEIPRWSNAKLEVCILFERSQDTIVVDFQGRAVQSNQAGYKEGQAPFC